MGGGGRELVKRWKKRGLGRRERVGSRWDFAKVQAKLVKQKRKIKETYSNQYVEAISGTFEIEKLVQW